MPCLLLALLLAQPVASSGVPQIGELSGVAQAWRDCGLPVPSYKSSLATVSTTPLDERGKHVLTLGFVEKSRSGQTHVLIGSVELAVDQVRGVNRWPSWSVPGEIGPELELQPSIEGAYFREDVRVSGAIGSYMLGHEALSAWFLSHPAPPDFSSVWLGWPKEPGLAGRAWLEIEKAALNGFISGRLDRQGTVAILRKVDASGSITNYPHCPPEWTVHSIVQDLADTGPLTGERSGKEKAIDQLVDSSGYLCTSHLRTVEVHDRIFNDVMSLGREAVPALQRRLKDKRLTRVANSGLNGLARLFSVGEVAEAAISEIERKAWVSRDRLLKLY
jgi:hypothetical protein